MKENTFPFLLILTAGMAVGLVMGLFITDEKITTDKPVKYGRYVNKNIDMRHLNYVWPEVFKDPNFQYGPKDVSLAVKDGLIGYGLFNLHLKEPRYFGHGLNKIADITGTDGTHPALLELVREWD